MLNKLQEQVVKKIKFAGLTRVPILRYLEVYNIDIGVVGDIIIIPENNNAAPPRQTPLNPNVPSG